MKAFKMGINKAEFMKEILEHQAADNFLKGTYDSDTKGCAVGCSLKSVAKLKNIKIRFDTHKEYENHLGIPEWLARLEDTIFEGVTLERSKVWPVEFSEAINEGADLNRIKTPFIIYLMDQNLEIIRSCKYDEASSPQVKSAIDQTEKALLQMIEAQKSGDKDLISAARSAAESAWSAARSAAESAWSAARSAAESAWSAASSAAWSAASSAAWSAWSAASSAAWSAASSAESARSAAELAAWSAAWSAWSAAWSAARSAAFEKHADKLLKLLRSCHD